MRWSCSGPLSRRVAAALAGLILSGAALAQGDPAADRLRSFDPPDPVLRYIFAGREIAVQPWDIMAVELSESGGITDIFLRLAPEAAGVLATLTGQGHGAGLEVRVCGRVIHRAAVANQNATGTLYLPNTTAARGELVRALWQGRVRCDTVGAEVFTDGH